MSRIWLSILENEIFLVIIEKLFSIFQVVAVWNQIFWAVPIFLQAFKHSVLRSEIRYSTFCRNACTSEEYNVIAIVYNLLQCTNFIHDSIYVLVHYYFLLFLIILIFVIFSFYFYYNHHFFLFSINFHNLYILPNITIINQLFVD